VLIALLICVVVAGAGTFAVVRLGLPFLSKSPGAPHTPVPLCARPATPTSTASTATPGSATATNIRVSNDTFLAHSEPMVAINPTNPLNLVGGSKFFTNPSHYRFQIGTYASFDGGCTWKDNGVLPGFASNELTSDVSVAFGPDNRVYVAVLYNHADDSGIAVNLDRWRQNVWRAGTRI
jgi:hypothetical protein